MAAVGPFALFDEPAGAVFYTALLTRGGDVRGGVVNHGKPSVGVVGSRLTHFSAYPTATVYPGNLDHDRLIHDCVRDCCAPVVVHPEWLAVTLKSRNPSIPTDAESKGYTPWDPAAPAELSLLARLNPSVAESIVNAGKALGILIASQISVLSIRRALILGPAEVLDERCGSARLYLAAAREVAAGIGVGGPLAIEPRLRSAKEIDEIADWLDSG